MNLPGKFGVSGNVVMELVKNLPANKNFKFYFDNWFSSVDHECLLKQQSIRSVATICSNRLKGCTLLSDKKLKLNRRRSIDRLCKKTEGISVVKWYDNKPVYHISTFCIVDIRDQCKRGSVFEKKRIDEERPHIVKKYNHHRGGVDICGMMLKLFAKTFVVINGTCVSYTIA